MRLASTVVLILSISACASLSQRPTDLQPAVVIASEPTKPAAKQHGLWDGCFNDALAAAPGLVPRLAQDCCLGPRANGETLAWCQRHAKMMESDTLDDGRDTTSTAEYHRWIRESSFCQKLKELKANGPSASVTDFDIGIQCRISDVMGARFRK
ncbi:MAG: hypothetical protein WC551_02850 [Patescibacteria group bacterium]